MRIYNWILYMSIYVYVIFMPILKSKYEIANIPANGDVLLILVFCIYLFGIVFLKNTRNNFIKGIGGFFKKSINLSILALIIMMFISLAYAGNKNLALKETFRFCTYIGLYFIIFCEGKNKVLLDGILKSYILVSTIIGCIGVYDYFEGIGINQIEGNIDRVRIMSTLENSNNLAAFFLLLVFPVILLAVNEKVKKKKVFYIVISLIFIFNIIFSFSRNAWLALAIGFVCLAVMYSFKFLFFLLAFGGIGLFIPPIFNRIKEFGDMTQNVSRIKIWTVSKMIIHDYFIKGVGNGNFPIVAERYMNQRKGLKTSNFIPYHPHNIFLKMQTELGISGSLAFIAIIISVMLKLKYFIKKVNNSFYKNFYKGFFVSFIAFLSMNIIDDFFSAPKVIAFFWILIAVFNSYEYNIGYKN